MENPKMIRAEAVDAMEFPELSRRFKVQECRKLSSTLAAGSSSGRILSSAYWMRSNAPCKIEIQD